MGHNHFPLGINDYTPLEIELLLLSADIIKHTQTHRRKIFSKLQLNNNAFKL